MMKKEHIHTRTPRILTTLLALFCICLSVEAKRVGVYCYLSGNELSSSSDGRLRTSLVVTPTGGAVVEIENLTDEIVFVNRGNSFVFVNGQSAPMFIPSSQSESHTVMEGTTERVWRDMSWINGEAHTNSQTVFERRILPVAPHGRTVLFAWNDLPRLLRNDIIETHYKGQGTMCRKGRFLTFGDDDEQAKNGSVYTLGEKFRKGDYRHYQPDSSPLTLGVDIQYSFDDPLQYNYNHNSTQQEGTHERYRTTVFDYVETIAIGSYEGVGKDGRLATNYPPMGQGRPCFAFRNGRNASYEIGTIAALGALVGIFIVAEAAQPDMPSDFPF